MDLSSISCGGQSCRCGIAHINSSLGHESNTSLRINRLVLREEFEFVVLVFEVADVAVTNMI